MKTNAEVVEDITEAVEELRMRLKYMDVTDTSARYARLHLDEIDIQLEYFRLAVEGNR